MSYFYQFNKPVTVEWVGQVNNRESSIQSNSSLSLNLCFGGVEGDSHFGLTRSSCVRVEELYPEESTIRNVRQITVVSVEELDLIAKEMGMNYIRPEWLGANIVIRGVPSFTLIPPSTRLQFHSGGTITIDLLNQPCNFPAREIEKQHPGKGKLFKSAAHNRRGVTGWVEQEGSVKIRDTVKVFVPSQEKW